MGKRVPKRLSLGGQYVAGDAGTIPDGSTFGLLNIFPRPNRGASRPPFQYDGLAFIRGMANWFDATNRVRRLFAISGAKAASVKGVADETWSALTSTQINPVVNDFANYRGSLFLMLSTTGANPDSKASYDGNVLTNFPFMAQDLQGTTITLFNDRLYIAGVYLTVYVNDAAIPSNNRAELGYDWSAAPTGGAFSYTNVLATVVASGATKICRLTPTSTAGNACSVYPYSVAIAPLQQGVTQFTSGVAPQSRFVTWLFSSRGVDAVVNVPYTIEWVLFSEIARNQTLALDAVMTTGEFRYRVKAAGVTAAVAPAFNTTAGVDTIDGTVTFTCLGSAVLAAAEGTVPNVSTRSSPIGRYLTAFVPPCSNAVTVTPRLKIYNSSQPALTTLAPIDISYRDGLADTDSQKANWGQQFTYSAFQYPFYNKETATNSVVYLPEVLYSEFGSPTQFMATNSYALNEGNGFPSAAIAAGGRYIAFKRDAYWIFQATTDPLIPIRREGTAHIGVGCIGPRALDTYEDIVFFIGESDIYQMEPGDTPTPICGDGMREEIMNHGADWVESQLTYKMPILAIDKDKLIVWVYTQKAKLYAYDLRAKLWSTHQVGDGFEVAAMLWNQNTKNFYVAFGDHGLARMDYATGATTGANDTIDNSGTSYPGTMSVTFKAVEIDQDGLTLEFKLEHMTPRISCKVTGQQLTGAYSFDGGETFPKSQTLAITSLTTGKQFKPVRLDCQQSDTQITPKIECTGKLGEAAFALSPKVYCLLDVLKPQVTADLQTPGASNL